MTVEAAGADILAAAWSRPDPASSLELAREFERLFVGPGPVPCPPYESYWRDDAPPLMLRTLMGPCVDQVVELYARIGLQVRQSVAELPDHVAVELEGLHRAANRSDAAPVADALVAEHLAVWLPAFCVAVARETTEEYYRRLASTTLEWVNQLVAGRAG